MAWYLRTVGGGTDAVEYQTLEQVLGQVNTVCNRQNAFGHQVAKEEGRVPMRRLKGTSPLFSFFAISAERLGFTLPAMRFISSPSCIGGGLSVTEARSREGLGRCGFRLRRRCHQGQCSSATPVKTLKRRGI